MLYRGVMRGFYVKIVSILILSSIAFRGTAAEHCTGGPNYYPYNKHQTPIPEKVQSADSSKRVYFYSLPKEECKTTTFVINNEKLLKYRDENGFSYVNYINKNSELIDGWVKKENIIPDSDSVNGLSYNDFKWDMPEGQISLIGKATPELDAWIKEKGFNVPEPESHGFNKGFETWVLFIQGVSVSISQTNSIIEKRTGFNDTFISEISFFDNKHKTVRGVSVGDGWDKVVSMYGNESRLDRFSQCRYYQYFDMRLNFCLDSKNIIQSISFNDYPTEPRQ